MQYPTLLEYMKAIQDAGNNLDKLSHLSVVLDGHGEPYHISGDSSVVFKMQDKTTGKCYALKCFTKAQKGCADASSTSSSMKYLEKELLVLSQGKEEKYPVLLMDWVDGDSLGASQLKVEDMSTEATKAELNEAITDEFSVKYSKDGRKLLKVPQKLKGTYAIKEGTKIICDRAFEDCKSLRSLVIPNSVTSIGESAFSFCSSLKSIVLPDGITSIGDETFFGCSSLASLVIPDGVTSIGNGAFAYCGSLKNLVLPESVVSIKGNLFCKWNGEAKCLSPNFIFEDGVLFNKDKSTIISFRDKDITSYVIPDYVTSIGGDAFSGCESLTSLVISNSVTHIAVGAFLSCTSLSSVVIPDGVTSIGEGAFIGCESLKSIVLPDGVVSIEKDAFRDCNFPNDFKQKKLISRFGDKIFG